jgi:transposase
MFGPYSGSDVARRDPRAGPAMDTHRAATRTFQSTEQAAAYLGLVPLAHQSGTSVRGRPHLSKMGPPRARAMLYMAAVVAIRYNPHVKRQADQLVAMNRAVVFQPIVCTNTGTWVDRPW